MGLGSCGCVCIHGLCVYVYVCVCICVRLAAMCVCVWVGVGGVVECGVIGDAIDDAKYSLRAVAGGDTYIYMCVYVCMYATLSLQQRASWACTHVPTTLLSTPCPGPIQPITYRPLLRPRDHRARGGRRHCQKGPEALLQRGDCGLRQEGPFVWMTRSVTVRVIVACDGG